MSEGDAQQDLIAQAISGDRVALERLLLAHYARLSNHVAGKLGRGLATGLSVDDLVQETFIQAVRDIGKCQCRTARSFAAWLNAIADHRVLDAVKQWKRKKRGGDLAQVHGAAAASTSMADLVALLSAGGHRPDRSAARREAVEAVQVGIAGLPDDQRRAVRLHHLDGKSIEEAAAAMGRTPAAVRGLLHRANLALRDALVRSTLWLSRK